MTGPYQLWNDADLAYMRAVQSSNLPDTCTVQRPTLVKNGEGGYNTVWVDTYTDIPCRMWISSGTSGTSEESRHWGDREVNFTEAFIIVSWDVDVDEKDQIVWTHYETGSSRAFKVVGTNKHDSITTATRCRVEGLR